MKPETIGVTVTYKEPVTFRLRMIGIAEENKLRQKLFGLSEDEKTEKQYQLNVEMLADLSEEMPEGLFPNSPKEKSDTDTNLYIDEFKTVRGAIEAFFSDRTVLKERIAEYVVRGYFVRLQPDVSFL